MIDYATIANTVGAFPDVVGQNASGPGATDGTPYLKSVIDDLWGARQALLDAAGMTPTGVTESASASQQKEAIQKVSGGPGEVVPWMGDAADPGVGGIRLLPLNGQGILRANYTDLDAAAYVGDPDNPTASAFYHADDSGGTIRNTAGVYLILPDCRGNHLRGLDPGALRDPDGAARDMGNQQAYAVRTHRHRIVDNAGFNDFYIQQEDYGTTLLFNFLSSTSPGANPIAYEIGMTQANVSSESRPYNITCRWCIRY